MNPDIRIVSLCLLTLLCILLYAGVFRLDQETYEEEPLFKTSTQVENIRTRKDGSILPHNATSLMIKTLRDSPRTEHLVDILKAPSKLAQFDFKRCRMFNCFDYSNCLGTKPIGVHIIPKSNDQSSNFSETGESNIIHANILEIIRRSEYYEPDSEKACLFVLEDDTLDRDPLSKSFKINLPSLLSKKYRYGLNYLVFNLYSGSWPDYREDDFAGFELGAAILAKASNSISNHRARFDISIPLFSHLHPTKDDIGSTGTSQNLERPYLLTFKGKRYVIGPNGDTRNSLYHLNNGRDIILLTTCRHGKRWRDSVDERCSSDDSTYVEYDFVELMKKSRFCLTPRGRRLGSFRYLEAMSYGCIPVVLSDGWVKPFDEVIDWSKAVIQFDEDQILLVPDMLRDIQSSQIESMQYNIDAIYKKYFSNTKKIVLTTLSILDKRMKGAGNGGPS